MYARSPGISWPSLTSTERSMSSTAGVRSQAGLCREARLPPPELCGARHMAFCSRLILNRARLTRYLMLHLLSEFEKALPRSIDVHCGKSTGRRDPDDRADPTGASRFGRGLRRCSWNDALPRRARRYLQGRGSSAEGIHYRARLCPCCAGQARPPARCDTPRPARRAEMAGGSNRQHHALHRISRGCSGANQGCRSVGG
jgi:hypothetical protein